MGKLTDDELAKMLGQEISQAVGYFREVLDRLPPRGEIGRRGQ